MILKLKRIAANFCKLVLTKFQVKIKSQNIQTDASCTKLAIELCCILIILTKLELFIAFKILNTAILGTEKIRGRKQTFRCRSYLYRFQGKNEKNLKSTNINVIKINNNNKTNTKHEFIVKYEGY